MKAKKTAKPFAGLLAAMLCMAAFSMTAFASADESWCEYGDFTEPTTQTVETAKPVTKPATTTKPVTTPQKPAAGQTPSKVPVSAETVQKPTVTGKDESSGTQAEGSTALTPSGNLSLVDDILQTGKTEQTEAKAEREDKQFLTVQSKNGNYFYLIVDRSGKEENVHFLNQVDEADLMALIDVEEPEPAPVVCTCKDRCMVGSIDLSCPLCQTTMSECTGKEPVPEEEKEEPDMENEKKETKSGSKALPLLVLMLALAGGGAAYYLKFRNNKPDTKGPVDLDDYDFGEDEDDEDYKLEPDDYEPEEMNEGD